MIFTKFPVFSYFFYFFDSKTLKNSNLVDGERGGLLLGLGGSVSKIFRGLLLGFRVVAIPELFRGVSGGGRFLGFLSLRGVGHPPHPPPPPI